MRTINNLKLIKSNKNIFSHKPYKALSKIIIVIYCLFMLVYLFRESLYKLNNQYITLFAGTAPNLIPSFLFTLIGMFYIVPFFKGIDSINKPMFIWLINAFNMIIFLLIEYLHVIFNLGSWDNNDMIASLIGIIISTVIYFKLRKDFIKKYDN
jgi:TRAP-type uncharacterized transport system fused permease subunit